MTDAQFDCEHTTIERIDAMHGRHVWHEQPGDASVCVELERNRAAGVMQAVDDADEAG